MVEHHSSMGLGASVHHCIRLAAERHSLMELGDCTHLAVEHHSLVEPGGPHHTLLELAGLVGFERYCTQIAEEHHIQGLELELGGQ